MYAWESGGSLSCFILQGNYLFSGDCFYTNSKNYSTDGFGIYPNPTDGIFSLKGLPLDKKVALEIISLDGKSRDLFDELNTQRTFDMTHLPAGIYYVKIKYGHKTEVLKLVKVRNK